MNAAQDKRDAERYRYLKKHARIEDRDGGNSGSYWFTPVDKYDNYCGNGAKPYDRGTLDKAIDFAMKKEET